MDAEMVDFLTGEPRLKMIIAEKFQATNQNWLYFKRLYFRVVIVARLIIPEDKTSP